MSHSNQSFQLLIAPLCPIHLMGKMMSLVKKTKTFWSIKPDIHKLIYSGSPAKMDIDEVSNDDLCYLGNIAKLTQFSQMYTLIS